MDNKTKPSNESAAVAKALAAYYDGLYRGDTSALGQVFHPEAHYVTASGGELVHLDMESYLPKVQARASPKSQGAPYHYTLESIEFAGPVTALARMRSSMLGKDFVDFLSMIKIHGEWRIVSKVFHYEDQQPQTPEREE